MEAGQLGAFRRGEREAVELVYREHVGEVERFVRSALYRVHRLSAANLADVVQEIFVKAFSANARTSYDGVRPYSTFLMAVARNAFLDWLRRTRHDVVVDLDSNAIVEPSVAEAVMFGPELVATATSYVQSLPPALRAVHEKRFVLAESQEQAAQSLGISRQNLRTLERKLVDGLRRAVQRAQLLEDSLPKLAAGR
jgi:RNA polymerase sigma-70 factor (ECF subfamily)